MIVDSALKDPQRDYRIFFNRLLFCAVVVVLMLLLLLWRYSHLQVSRYADFAARSDSNRILVRPVPPPRGLIFDRNGVLLADNRPSFNLVIVKELAGDLEGLIGELQLLIDISDSDIDKFYRQLQQRQRPYEAVPIRMGLSEQELGVLAVNEHNLPGIQITAELLRHYPLGEQLAHVVGYMGRINEQEIQQLDPVRYQGTHMVGKTGLEKKYEDQLLGDVGYEKVETNARGRVMRVLEKVDPLPGQDLYLNLDVRLQEVAYQALQGERGAVVALDVATGGVLAMASAPSFDPNLFVSGISRKDYNALLASPDRPLFDRVLMGQYPPGSTVKPVYGLAALESGTIKPSHRIFDIGFYQLENNEHKYRDWKRGGHGWVTLDEAIAWSCDTFFYDIGFRMGIDTMSEYGRKFGFGVKTGIDMPSEAIGIMPSRTWKRSAKSTSWYHGDTVNTSIGQGYMLVTPVQLAVMTARLATKGVVWEPRLKWQLMQTPIAEENASIAGAEENWRFIHTAMEHVVHSPRGTAQGIRRDLAYRMAGKTGTAQVIGIQQDEEYDAEKVAKHNRDHALFVAFAPVDNPRIAVSVIVENGEHGSSMAAPVARKVIDAYMQYSSQETALINADTGQPQ